MKIFSFSDINKVEKTISEWLETEKPEICFVKQSESMGKGEWHITITIWHK
jgi:hypothetical protein